jgi:hypothetical protein
MTLNFDLHICLAIKLLRFVHLLGAVINFVKFEFDFCKALRHLKQL